MNTAATPHRLVGLIGAECTGKSTLAQQLAAHFNGLYVPEVLRGWCLRYGRTPQAHEQLAIFQAQVNAENAAVAQARKEQTGIIFVDSPPLLTAVYSDHYFADRTLYPGAHSHHHRYALTLWLQPDLPWLADGVQRDGAAAQAAVQALLACALATHAPVIRVAGQPDVRLQTAISATGAIQSDVTR